MLSTPTLVNQLTAGGANPHADCGEADARSNLVDAGHNDPVALIEQTIGGDLRGGTTTVQLAAAMTKLGLPARAVASVGEVDAALSRRHRIIVEIPSDHYGNPLPGSTLGHFVLVYGFDGANYHAMNPLGGRLVAIPASVLIECEKERQFRAVEIEMVMPADQAAPAPAPTPVPAPHPAPAPKPRPSVAAEVMPECTAGAHVRASASLSAPVLATLRAGTPIRLVGAARGPEVMDLEEHRLTPWWYELSTGGWIASGLVKGNWPGCY